MSQSAPHVTATSNSSRSFLSKSNCCSFKGLSGYLRESMKAQLDDVRSTVFWKAFLAEVIGTFFLVFLIIGSLMHNPNKEGGPSHLHVALLAGFFIATIIMTFLHVSGGHVNPAISIGFLVTRHISLIRFLSYIAAQLLGAIAGAYMLKVLCPTTMHAKLHTIKPDTDMSDLQAVIMEFIVTFFLLFAAFSMIDHGRKDVSGSIPLGIGIIVVVNILACGNKSGCLMNPALNFGPAVITGDWQQQWTNCTYGNWLGLYRDLECIMVALVRMIYWVGDLLGAVAGTLMYDKIFSANSSDKCHIRSCCLGVQPSTRSEGDLSYDETETKSAGKIYTSLPSTKEKEMDVITTM